MITNLKKEKLNYIDFIEKKYLKDKFVFNVGDIVKIGYTIPEGEKERIQYYEGLIIAKKNKGLGKSFTLRRNVQGIGVEQVFLLYSPKILSLVTKQQSKIRRAKLYYLRKLTGKASRIKEKLAFIEQIQQTENQTQ